MRLQLPRLRLLHLLADLLDVGRAHHLGEQRAFLQRLPQLLADRGVDDLVEPRPDLRLVAVADRFDQEVAERGVLEDLVAEHVEDATAECLRLLGQLAQQALEDLTLARLGRDEVPHVADLGLADAVDSPEPLLDPVRIPRQVVVDHQVRALEVDALPGGVGRDEHADVGILAERLLRFAAHLTPHAAVDLDDRLASSQQRADAVGQVVERVAMLGEDDQLPALAGLVEHLGLWCLAAAPQAASTSRRCLLVARARRGPQGREACRSRPRARRSSSRRMPDRRPPPRGLRARHRAVSSMSSASGASRPLVRSIVLVPAAPAEPFLVQTRLEPLAAAAERLIDRLGRGGKPPLQDGEREPDDVSATAFALGLQPVGAVHLLAHVLGDLRVEQRFLGRERVVDGVGAALGEERLALERQQLLLDHPAHQPLRVERLRALARLALEAVWVDQRHEQLEVLRLAAVRGRRHQQQVARDPARAARRAGSAGSSCTSEP